MKKVALALCVLAIGCKSKKSEPAPGSATGSASVADASFDSGSPGEPSLGTNEPPPPAPAAAMPSESLVAAVPKGPMRTADGARVVWCTRGDNGMAEWAEVLCHVAAPGKKTNVIPVMTYADAMAVDEGVDPAGDADAGVKAAGARERVAAGLARLATDGGADLVAMPAPVRCSFQGGALTGRSDDSSGAAEGCDVGGVTAHITAPGKVTLAHADKSLLAEVFKARPRGKGDGGNECYLEAASVELSVDAAAKTVAVAIALSNPSDACALVTEYEVRAAKLP